MPSAYYLRLWLATGLALQPLVVLAQALTLLAVSPARNAPAAPRGGPVQLTFSQPVGAPVLDSAIAVFGNLTGRRAGTFSGNGTSQITFTPAQPLLANEEVQVVVTRRLVATTGDSLARPQLIQLRGATDPASMMFATPNICMMGARPQWLAPGDFDGDGDVDLMAYNFMTVTTGTLSFSFNDGTAQFAARATVPDLPIAGSAPVPVFGDLDNDGDLDLAIGSSQGLQVFHNDGTGLFAPLTPQPVIVGAQGNVALADVNGDGWLDLAMPIVRYNDRHGQLLIPSGLASNPYQNLSENMADLDNDGGLDGVLNVQSQSLVTIFINYSAAPNTPAPWSTDGYTNETLADFDNDGTADVLVTWQTYSPSGNGSLHHLFARGLGSRQFTLLPSSPTGIRGALGDMNGDGLLDFLTTSVTPAFAVVTLNQGNMNFARATVAMPPTNLPGPPLFYGGETVADFDGDGRLDFATRLSDTHVAIYLNPAPTGLPAEAVDQGLTLSPNPAHDYTTLTLPAPEATPAQLLDALGRVVRSSQFGVRSSNLDLRGLPAGLYTVRVGAVVQRLVVE